MSRSMLLALLVLGLATGVGFAPATLAQNGAPHPLVGSWLVSVEVAGEPPLVLPNLASFTADGIVLVSAPVLLPELPSSGASRGAFSAGHGAWTASTDDSAAIRFVFLVVDEQGNPASINLVDGQLTVAADGATYEGDFSLTILSAVGQDPTPTSGTWRAARIAPHSEPVTMPMPDAAATPVA